MVNFFLEIGARDIPQAIEEADNQGYFKLGEYLEQVDIELNS